MTPTDAHDRDRQNSRRRGAVHAPSEHHGFRLGVHGSGAGNCHVAASHPGRRIPFVNGSSFGRSIGAVGRKPMIGNEALSGAGASKQRTEEDHPETGRFIGFGEPQRPARRHCSRIEASTRPRQESSMSSEAAKAWTGFEVDDPEGQDCLDHSCSWDESASRKSLCLW